MELKGMMILDFVSVIILLKANIQTIVLFISAPGRTNFRRVFGHRRKCSTGENLKRKKSASKVRCGAK
jgi:hypothetical protein